MARAGFSKDLCRVQPTLPHAALLPKPIKMRIRSVAAGCLFLHAEPRMLAQHITGAECSKQGYSGGSCGAGPVLTACMPGVSDAG